MTFTSESIREAVFSKGIVIMIDAIITPIITPISNEYYVIKGTYSRILVCSYYIISKVSASVAFNTFPCFNAFIVRYGTLTKPIKEYTKCITIDSPT